MRRVLSGLAGKQVRFEIDRDAVYKVRRWGRASMGKAMCAGLVACTRRCKAAAEAKVGPDVRCSTPTHPELPTVRG